LYRLSFLTVIILTLSFYSGCDSALEPSDYDEVQPFVRNLEVNPSSINFDPQTDGQKDTTISINVSVEGENFEGSSFPFYSIFIDQDDLPSYQGKLSVTDSRTGTFSNSVDIPTNTIDFRSYTIVVTPSNQGNNSNYARSVVNQTGVPINAPEILEVDNPAEVEIPNDDSRVRVRFTAKVVDPDGQDNIDRVFIEYINPDGSILVPNPTNRLLDNGTNSNSTTEGDEVAGDSVYTIQFFIDSSSSPVNRTARYFAIDKSGLSSDTLETPFNLVDNE